MDPIWNLGLVDVVPENLFVTGNVYIVIGSGPEIIFLGEAKPVCHYPDSASQNGHHRDDGDHFENFVLA